MVSDTKTSTAQLDLLMEALKTSIRKALNDDLSLDEGTESKKLHGYAGALKRKNGDTIPGSD